MQHNVKSIRLYRKEMSQVTDYDRWKFESKNWFTQKAWDWLQKMGCLSNPIDEKETVEIINVDCGQLFTDVYNQIVSLRGAYITPQIVYLGLDKFNEYLYDPRVKEHMGYIDFEVKEHHQYKMYGFPVKVVPHMEGWLIV